MLIDPIATIRNNPQEILYKIITNISKEQGFIESLIVRLVILILNRFSPRNINSDTGWFL